MAQTVFTRACHGIPAYALVFMIPGNRRNLGWIALAGVVLLPSCAIVRVDEDWNLRKDRTVPLAEAGLAWQEIKAGRIPEDSLLDSYNRAVRGSVSQIAANWTDNQSALNEIRTERGSVRIDVSPGDIRSFELIDEIVPADYIKIEKGFEKKDVGVDGVGASLMVRQRWTENDSMIPKSGLWYPVTGVLDLDQPDRPVLTFVDPTRHESLFFSGRPIPLSVDYTATFARDFHDRQNLFGEVSGLLRFEKFADRMGLYRVSAFDPTKEPCVLVHGINSTPMTWHLFLNQAYEDPEIRSRYEFWTFGYPTGAPIPYLAAKLRDSLRDLTAFRRANGAQRVDITLVGHSMGGLLSKAATQRGGDDDWNKLFSVPIEQLEVSAQDREILRNLVYFEPVAEIDAVVLCAVPHRGSELAAKPGAKLVGDLVQVPQQLAELTRDIVRQSSYALTPVGRELAEQPNSIAQLNPNSRVTAEFLNKPLSPQVQFYSVIGRKDPRKPLEQSSDGVVPYYSSHMVGVVSEKVIDNSPHGVHREPGGIAEIIRILKQL